MLYENNKIWLYVVKHVLVALMVFIFVLLVDMNVLPLKKFIPDLFWASEDLSKSILTTLAGALLTVTTFTFSITMVVLTTYSSNYSPRIVENFLSEKSTMKVFGVFIGGFIYCILSLFFMRDEPLRHNLLSAGVAILYSLYCMIEFIVFIFRVANAIQPQRLIAALGTETSDIINKFLETHSKFDRTDTYKTDSYTKNYTIKLNSNDGYLEIINLEAIKSVLRGKEYAVIIKAHRGDYICNGQEVACLFCSEEIDFDETMEEKLSKAFSTADKRYAIEDYRFAMQKIVEIALRAISPGINDPYTAINCIQVLGVLLSKVSTLNGAYVVFRDEKNELKSFIIIEDYNFKNDLYYTFFQIIHYGKEDISIVLALFDALYIIDAKATLSNKKHIDEMASYIYDSVIKCYDHPLDKKLIKEKYETVKEIRNQL